MRGFAAAAGRRLACFVRRLKHSNGGRQMDSWFGGVIVLILIIVPLWRICGRSGFSPALSLIAIIPWLGFLIVAAILGFAEWPSLKDGQKR